MHIQDKSKGSRFNALTIEEDIQEANEETSNEANSEENPQQHNASHQISKDQENSDKNSKVQNQRDLDMEYIDISYQGIQNLDFAIGKFNEKTAKQNNSINKGLNQSKSLDLSQKSRITNHTSKKTSLKPSNNNPAKRIDPAHSTNSGPIQAISKAPPTSPLQDITNNSNIQDTNLVPTKQANNNAVPYTRPNADSSHHYETATRMDFIHWSSDGPSSSRDHAPNGASNGTRLPNLDGDPPTTSRALDHNDNAPHAQVCMENAN